jgi:hypothetical protein
MTCARCDSDGPGVRKKMPMVVFPQRLHAAMPLDRLAQLVNSLVDALERKGIRMDLPTGRADGRLPRDPSPQAVDEFINRLRARFLARSSGRRQGSTSSTAAAAGQREPPRCGCR